MVIGYTQPRVTRLVNKGAPTHHRGGTTQQSATDKGLMNHFGEIFVLKGDFSFEVKN